MSTLIQMKNNWRSKVYRTVTSVLPVSEDRIGNCINCGECCKLPNKCIFLKHEKDGNACCLIYKIRPLNCRKYPISKKEHITRDVCSYEFKKPSEVWTVKK